MRLVTRSFGQEEWTDIVSGFPDLSLIQTWEYGEAKARTGPWQVERAIFLDGERVTGAVQAMVRRIPLLKGGLVWINRGPLWRQSPNGDPSMLAAMMEELRRYWVERQHMYLRIAPPIGEAEVDVSTLEATGYRRVEELTGWASATLDLSKSEEEIRGAFKRKWRGDLNSAERQGVCCIVGRSSKSFEEFLLYYEAFLSTRKLHTSVTPQLLRQIQTLLPDERKMWVLQGALGVQHLGGLLMACCGDTCLALAGSSPNQKGRTVESGNLLWWRAIVKMKELGYRWLDLGGTDPERTPRGILHFKDGMSGTPYILLGDFEAQSGGLLSNAIRWRVSRALRPDHG